MRFHRFAVSVGAVVALSLGSVQVAAAHPGHGDEPNTGTTASEVLTSADQSVKARQGWFRVYVDAEVSSDLLVVHAVGDITPRKGKRIRFYLPDYGVNMKAKITKKGVWEAVSEVPLRGGEAPDEVRVKVRVKQKGVKKPLLRWKHDVAVSFIPSPEPIPDEFFNQVSPERLAELSQDASAFRFAVQDGGTPVRWDPCTPIDVVVDPTGLHPDALTDVQRAFDELSAASGLSFTPVQVREDLPAVDGQGNIPRVPGAITVSTATPDDIPALAGNVLGLGGVSYLGANIQAGYVSLDMTDNLTPGFRDSNSLGRVLLHELGHAINLGHVDNPGQVMNPQLLTGGPESYQAGDRAGMLALTGGGCQAG